MRKFKLKSFAIVLSLAAATCTFTTINNTFAMDNSTTELNSIGSNATKEKDNKNIPTSATPESLLNETKSKMKTSKEAAIEEQPDKSESESEIATAINTEKAGKETDNKSEQTSKTEEKKDEPKQDIITAVAAGKNEKKAEESQKLTEQKQILLSENLRKLTEQILLKESQNEQEYENFTKIIKYLETLEEPKQDIITAVATGKTYEETNNKIKNKFVGMHTDNKKLHQEFDRRIMEEYKRMKEKANESRSKMKREFKSDANEPSLELQSLVWQEFKEMMIQECRKSIQTPESKSKQDVITAVATGKTYEVTDNKNDMVTSKTEEKKNGPESKIKIFKFSDGCCYVKTENENETKTLHLFDPNGKPLGSFTSFQKLCQKYNKVRQDFNNKETKNKNNMLIIPEEYSCFWTRNEDGTVKTFTLFNSNNEKLGEYSNIQELCQECERQKDKLKTEKAKKLQEKNEQTSKIEEKKDKPKQNIITAGATGKTYEETINKIKNEFLGMHTDNKKSHQEFKREIMGECESKSKLRSEFESIKTKFYLGNPHESTSEHKVKTEDPSYLSKAAEYKYNYDLEPNTKKHLGSYELEIPKRAEKGANEFRSTFQSTMNRELESYPMTSSLTWQDIIKNMIQESRKSRQTPESKSESEIATTGATEKNEEKINKNAETLKMKEQKKDRSKLVHMLCSENFPYGGRVENNKPIYILFDNDGNELGEYSKLKELLQERNRLIKIEETITEVESFSLPYGYSCKCAKHKDNTVTCTLFDPDRKKLGEYSNIEELIKEHHRQIMKIEKAITEVKSFSLPYDYSCNRAKHKDNTMTCTLFDPDRKKLGEYSNWKEVQNKFEDHCEQYKNSSEFEVERFPLSDGFYYTLKKYKNRTIILTLFSPKGEYLGEYSNKEDLLKNYEYQKEEYKLKLIEEENEKKAKEAKEAKEAEEEEEEEECPYEETSETLKTEEKKEEPKQNTITADTVKEAEENEKKN